MTMLVRINRLPRNQNAGFLDESPFRTVHQSPPKKTAPSRKPAIRDKKRCNISFIVILLFLLHFLVLFGYPVPCIQAADKKADDQHCECPGKAFWIVFI